MSDGISNDDSYRRSNQIPVRRSEFDRGGRILITQRPATRSEVKTPFQQVMDQVRSPSPDTTSPTTSDVRPEVEQPIQQAQHQEEPREFRQELQKKSRESDPNDRKDRAAAKEEGRTDGKVAEEKVVSKPSLGQRQRDGQEKGKQKENSQSWQGDRRTIAPTELKAFSKGKNQELGQTGFLLNLKEAQAIGQKRLSNPTVFSKTLLDQIVHYVQLMSKQGGEKEMSVSLHEKIFKGLRLRVAVVRQKAEVSFLTHSQEVRELFLANRHEIEQSLREKGIEVRSISVIMT